MSGCARVAALVAVLLATGCEKRSSPEPSPDDEVAVTLSGAPELPAVRITRPRFLAPMQITDPPAVYMLDGVDVNAGFSAHVGIQPASARRSPPACGIRIAKDAEHVVERPRDGVVIERCETDDGEREVVVDVAYRDAWDGPPFYCIATWHWKGAGALDGTWRRIAEATERACDTIEVAVR